MHTNHCFLLTGGKVKTDSRKIILAIVLLCAEGISFGMLIPRATKSVIQAIEKKRRDTYKEEAKNVKLLEHSCFKGESLLFQNEFFSSNYQWLPTSQTMTIGTILGRDQLGKDQCHAAVLDYHKYYRKICLDALVNVENHIDHMVLSYMSELFKKNTGMLTQGLLNHIKFEYALTISLNIFENMKARYRSNDYPRVLMLLEHMVSDRNV